jgi:NAD-dependent dihydropyrimidine dehydrogenase PreA subunit
VSVAELPRQDLVAILARYPEINQRFQARLREYQEAAFAAQTTMFNLSPQAIAGAPPVPSDAAARAGLRALVGGGVVEGTEVLVIDLDKCLQCDKCEDACVRRHGHSRMNRKGMVVGNISIATACRQCQDPVCMLCSRAGIARHPSGEVYISHLCRFDPLVQASSHQQPSLPPARLWRREFDARPREEARSFAPHACIQFLPVLPRQATRYLIHSPAGSLYPQIAQRGC